MGGEIVCRIENGHFVCEDEVLLDYLRSLSDSEKELFRQEFQKSIRKYENLLEM